MQKEQEYHSLLLQPFPLDPFGRSETVERAQAII